MCFWRNRSTAQDWSEEKQTELFAGRGTFPGGGEKQPEEQVLVCVLQDVHDGVVELGEHHEVHGQAGAAVLRGRVTREPGQGVVLLQHKPARQGRDITACLGRFVNGTSWRHTLTRLPVCWQSRNLAEKQEGLGLLCLNYLHEGPPQHTDSGLTVVQMPLPSKPWGLNTSSSTSCQYLLTLFLWSCI